MDKYFTPSVEDIRVGYECERGILDYSSTGPTKEWEMYVVGQEVDFTKSLRERETYRLPEPEFLRVPYLTKEQIEAEGWENYFNGPYSYSFSKGEYMVTYRNMMVGEERVISICIEKSVVGHQFPITLFHGKCRDINEFRTICKLLGI